MWEGIPSPRVEDDIARFDRPFQRMPADTLKQEVTAGDPALMFQQLDDRHGD